MEDIRKIREIVAAINEAWVIGDYDAMGPYVAEHVVMAPPGLEDARVLGRAAFIASYRQFAEVAKTREFSAGVPRVDVIGDTAVATCPFTIAYELEGETYREKGIDVLVFSRPAGDWKVVWRTLISEPEPLESREG